MMQNIVVLLWNLFLWYTVSGKYLTSIIFDRSTSESLNYFINKNWVSSKPHNGLSYWTDFAISN